KGAIIGFGDVHTRAHIYRAILEGLAYGLREGRERIERRSGVKIEKLRVSGGGSQSDLALQLTADIFNLPVERPHTYETSGLGAAIDAMVGLGVHPDFETATARMTRVGQTFQPNPEAVRIYDRLYREVYTRMYKQLRPLYQSIRAITGYPRERARAQEGEEKFQGAEKQKGGLTKSRQSTSRKGKQTKTEEMKQNRIRVDPGGDRYCLTLVFAGGYCLIHGYKNKPGFLESPWYLGNELSS